MEAWKGRKGKCGGKKGNGVPRKALKWMIQNEMDKQSRVIFRQIMREHRFAMEQAEEQPTDEQGAPVTHTNVACDGCEVNPIVGVRYKCSVRKNYDLCAECEERMDHPYPMLKIKKNNGAPSVMVTVLPEDEGAEDPTDENIFARPFGRGPHGHGPHGHGPHGRGPHGRGPHGHGPHGRGPHGRGPHGRRPSGSPGSPGNKHQAWKSMVNGFMEKMGMTIPEEMQKEAWAFMGGKRCGGGAWKGEKPWKKKRAIVVSKPDAVLEACPGQMLLPSVEILNGTCWPWKQGVFLGMDESVELANLPVEVVNVPIDFEVKGQETFKLSVPIKVHEHSLPSDEPLDFVLVFRGPNGNKFGEPIHLKLKVIKQQSQQEHEEPLLEKTEQIVQAPSEIETLKMAIKLHEGLNNGQSFDECL